MIADPEVQRDMVGGLLDALAEEHRRAVERQRNAERLRLWRARWWARHGTWPMDCQRLPNNVIPMWGRVS